MLVITHKEIYEVSENHLSRFSDNSLSFRHGISARISGRFGLKEGIGKDSRQILTQAFGLDDSPSI